MVGQQREARVQQLAFQSKVIELQRKGLLTQDDAFWLFRSVQDVYYAYRSASLTGQQWGQGVSAYYGLLVRQERRVADELRPSMLAFSKAMLE